MTTEELILNIEQTKAKICDIQELAKAEYVVSKEIFNSVTNTSIFAFDAILKELKK